MVVYIYLFDSKWAGHMDNVLQVLMRPFSWAVDKLPASFKMTTKEVADREEAPCYERYVILTFLVPALLILIILTAPLFLIAFLCWMPLQKSRHPFRYSCQNVQREVPLWEEKEAYERFLRVTTINTSLLPESGARNLNLSHTQDRAKNIVNAIVESQVGAAHVKNVPRKRQSTGVKSSDHEEIILSQARGSLDRGFVALPTESQNENQQGFAHSVSRDFMPNTDIVCLQGVFEAHTQQLVSQALHNNYSHVICDVGVYAWQVNQCRQGSGLITASRYPVSDVCFRCFQSRIGDDSKRSKGVLLTKLEIGNSSEGKKLVGFITNVHLQDGLGFTGVRTRQLNELRQWHREFRDSALGEREIVVFDLMCGHFGFDNISTADRENWTHDVMRQFWDPCRLSPGKDRSWALGTELVLNKIHEPEVSTPEGLKTMLEEPSHTNTYVQAAEVEGRSSNSEDVEAGTHHRGSRRVNYLLLAQNAVDHAYETVLCEFSTIARLTTMTAHLPISCGLLLRSAKQ